MTTEPLLFCLDVTGTPRERGIAQGRVLAERVKGHIDSLRSALIVRGISDPTGYLRALVADTRFERSIRLCMPHLLDEVDGIAEGAGCEKDLIYALQLMDEEWAYRSARLQAQSTDKCTSFALHDPQQHRTWIGQNMDLGGYTDGFQVVIRHQFDNACPRQLLLSTAGIIGLLGVNDAGVGVCVNSIPQLPSRNEGIPVAFMIRRLLEARSAQEAAALCRSLPHATSQHYLIADSTYIVSLECSAQGVEEYRSPFAARILHTNHPLARTSAGESTGSADNSVARLKSLEGRLAFGDPELVHMQAALSAFDDPDHPVCRLRSKAVGNINFTCGSMISELYPQAARIRSWISPGPPSELGYQRFGFD